MSPVRCTLYHSSCCNDISCNADLIKDLLILRIRRGLRIVRVPVLTRQLFVSDVNLVQVPRMVGDKTCRSGRDVHNVVVLAVFIEFEEVLSIEGTQGAGIQNRVFEGARDTPHKDHTSLLISLLHQRKLVVSSIVKQSVDRVCCERETAMLRTHIRCHGSLDLFKSIVPHDVTDSI